jgi:dipeptidyl aminopeptidase/acylaminoacyl peptidase
MQPFTATFRTPDRIFAYIGLEREEEGRLILYNLTQQRKTILTPSNLVVTEFEPYPDGQSILFSAIDADLTRADLLEQQLYRVTTGVSATVDGDAIAAGQVTPELTSETHQILNFDLSADGSIIVVQRVERDDPTQVGLWLIRDDQDPIPLDNQPGGVFQIAPDNQLIAMAQGEGIALLSLEPGAEPLDFLAQFGMVLDFTPDGTTAAMVDYNRDKPDLLYTRSLYLVTNQRTQEKIFDTQGSIVDCSFDPRGENLYCLLTNLLEGQEYAEQPYVAQVNLQTKEILPLTTLPDYRDIHLSVAPDGLALLFDQLVTDPEAGRDRLLQTDGGEAIVNSQLWILIPPGDTDAPPDLEELPFVGIQPQWLP